MKHLVLWLAVFVALPVVVYQGCDGSAAPIESDGDLAYASHLGKEVAKVASLRDHLGGRRPLREFSGHKALVLAFLGTECPISNRLLPILLDLEKKYRSRGAQFLAIYPNERETFDRVAAHAFDRQIPFPVLKDLEQSLAGKLGVDRVPHMCVLDGEFVVRYSGRFSDQFGVTYRRRQASRNDLEEAIDELVSGKKVSVPVTVSEGCLLDRAKPPTPRDVTYTRDVAPILQAKCQACHRPGRSAPFSLLDYDDASRWKRMIKEVVTQRRMPPWHADARHGSFSNDRSLSQDEIDVLVDWVDRGTPRGDPADEPAPRAWVEGWTIGEPDLVIEAPEEYHIAAAGDEYFEFVYVPNAITDAAFAEERWIQAAQILPSDPTVVHHVLAFIIHPGDRVDTNNVQSIYEGVIGWVPGEPSWVFPEGSAMWVPKGAQIYMELHYVPTGVAATDRPKIGFVFADEPPDRMLKLLTKSVGDLTIPPYDPHYTQTGEIPIDYDGRVLSLMGHMHARGKSYSFDLVGADQSKRRLLTVPRYDFNWQTFYWLDEPLEVTAGSRLALTAHWDNSVNNPLNPDPSAEVHYGWEYTSDMLVGWAYFETERTPYVLARQAFERGVKLAGLKRHDEAFEHYRRALDLYPGLYDAHNSMGVLYKVQEKLPEAVECFRRTVRINPDFLPGHRNLASLLMRQQKFAEAEIHIRKVVEADPSDIAGHRNLALVLFRQNKLPESESVLRNALRIAPGDAQVRKMLEVFQ